MNNTTLTALRIAEGPLFRFAIAIAVLGLTRIALLGLSDMTAAYLTDSGGKVFRHKLTRRLTWLFLPSLILHRVRLAESGLWAAYHFLLDVVSLIFRALIVVVPIFMVAHVHLWERALGISWPALPTRVADTLSIITILSGAALFLGRVYSPMLRAIEPGWSFFKPLLLIVPVATGILASHPNRSPIDYHVVLLIHVLSAVIVLSLLPFARLLTSTHTPLASLEPDTAWRAGSDMRMSRSYAAARS